MYLCLSRYCGLNKSGFRPRVRDDVPPPLSQHPHGVGSLRVFKVSTRPSYHYDAAKVQLFFELCKNLVKKEKIFSNQIHQKAFVFGNYIGRFICLFCEKQLRVRGGCLFGDGSDDEIAEEAVWFLGGAPLFLEALLPFGSCLRVF